MNYATLYQLRAELGLGADQTGDDALLGRHLTKGSRLLDQLAGRRFDVLREARRFDGTYRMLLLDRDLLAVIALANGDGSAVDTNQYWLEPASAYPVWGLRLRDSASVSWLPDAAGDYERAVTLDGLWGYHTDYAAAWADTLDTVLDNPLTSGGTTLTVANADGVAIDSDEPRLQAGNLLRFGPDNDDEMALVVSANYTANTAVIARGQQGSTAAAQPAGTKIYVFRPWASAQRALLRLATWSYRLKDATFFERITILGSTQKVAPAGIPDDVLDLLPVRPVVR